MAKTKKVDPVATGLKFLNALFSVRREVRATEKHNIALGREDRAQRSEKRAERNEVRAEAREDRAADIHEVKKKWFGKEL